MPSFLFYQGGLLAGRAAPANTVMLFEVTQNLTDVAGAADWRSTAANGGDGRGADLLTGASPQADWRNMTRA